MKLETLVAAATSLIAAKAAIKMLTTPGFTARQAINAYLDAVGDAGATRALLAMRAFASADVVAQRQALIDGIAANPGIQLDPE